MRALIAVDRSPESSAAVGTAASLDWPAGSRVEVLTVLPTDAELYGGPFSAFEDLDPTDEVHGRIEREGQKILDGALTRLGRDRFEIVGRRPQGRPASTIVEEADLMSADLIILGARGHSALERVLVGSVSSEVVDRAHCPVLVARGSSTDRILIGTDGSSEAMSAVSFIAESGLFRTSQVKVIHSVDLRPAWWLGFGGESATVAYEAYDTALASARERAAATTSMALAALEAAGLAVSTGVREGPPASAIVDEAAAWHADLVVVGTRGHGLVKQALLGSTARSVLQTSATSVLITRGGSARTMAAKQTSGAASAEPARP